MTTFSQLVDSVIVERKRPDLKAEAASWLNQTIRLMHARPNVSAPALYDANRFEESLVLAGSAPFTWTIPSATRFQTLEAIYSTQLSMYIEMRRPRISRKTGDHILYPDLFWYRTGPAVAISGVAAGDSLSISYFQFPAAQAYKEAAARKIQYDPETDSYTYTGVGTPADGGGTLGDPVTDESHLEKETNWLLQRWSTVLREGILAHLYRNVGDVERGRMSYSSFETGRLQVFQTEPMSGEA